MTPDDTPTKPIVMTMPDYRARLAAYRAVSQSEVGSLDGPVTTWDAVCVVVDSYLQSISEQKEVASYLQALRGQKDLAITVYDSRSGQFIPEDRWRDLAANENKVGCADPNCECGGPR